MTLDFEREASRVALKINTEVLNLAAHLTPICITEQNIVGIGQFVLLHVSANLATDFDSTRRINSVGSAFAVLHKIWKYRYLEPTSMPTLPLCYYIVAAHGK